MYQRLELNRTLKEKLDKEIPVINVVAVTGTTEQSAVDPVTAIVDLREKFRTKVIVRPIKTNSPSLSPLPSPSLSPSSSSSSSSSLLSLL